jgi:hypothetical protein
MSCVQFKPGVSCEGVSLNGIKIIVAANEVWRDCGFPHATVTAITDGKHMAGSRHYSGDAADIRTRDDAGGDQWAPQIKAMLRDALKNKLGKDFDVVVEGSHIHAEYDPK